MSISTKLTGEIVRDILDVGSDLTVGLYLKRLKEKFDVTIADSTLYQWAKVIEKATGNYPFVKAGSEYNKRIVEKTLAEMRGEN